MAINENGKVQFLDHQNDRMGRLEDLQLASMKEIAGHTEKLENMEGSIVEIKGSIKDISNAIIVNGSNLAILSSKDEGRTNIKGWVITLMAAIVGGLVEVLIHLYIK